MAENQNQGGFNARPFVVFVVLVILAMVVYQFLTGGVFKEVTIANLFHIIFVTPTPTPSISPQPVVTVTPTPTPVSRVELSRDFVVGTWRAEREDEDAAIGTDIDFEEDGRFSGQTMQFVGAVGQRAAAAGSWKFQKLSNNSFRLTMRYDNQLTDTATFKVIDENRVHNIKENYIAVRIKR